MPRSIKTLKWFVLAFVVGFLFPRTYGAALRADVLESTYDGYDLEEAIMAYHLQNNDTVNDYLEKLLDPDFAQDGYVIYPPHDEDCSKENVSTYCLSVVLNQNLGEFEKYLVSHKSEYNFSEYEGEDGSSVISLEEAFEAASAQRSTVNDQIVSAENTLDLTLAIYNQVQIVYPVHAELVELIKNMEDYRTKLSKVRDILELYPSKFNGATTAQCK